MILNLPTGRNGQITALGLAIVMVGAIWLGAVNPLMQWYAARNDTLVTRRLLANRMARLAATLPELQAATAAADAPTAVIALLEGETDAIAAANLQQRVQALASAAGATISSAEVLPVDRETAAGQVHEDRAIRLRLSLEAGWPMLMQFLLAIETGPPLMLIDDVRLEGTRALLRSAVPPMQANLTVTGFRRPTATNP